MNRQLLRKGPAHLMQENMAPSSVPISMYQEGTFHNNIDFYILQIRIYYPKEDSRTSQMD